MASSRQLWLWMAFGMCVLCGSPHAAETVAAPKAAVPPAEVMLIGLWHFDNPGLDAVKFKPIDITGPQEQRYLEGLALRLARFKPTKVLLEFEPKDEARFNARFADWQAGKFPLAANEIYQIGFRLAKAAGLKSLHGFDVREVPGADDKDWERLLKDPAHAKTFGTLVEEMGESLRMAHRTLGLRALLLRNNSDAEDRLNKSFYTWLSSTRSAEKPFLGADLAAQWWQRNFRMYHLIQQAAQPGERVVVIAGQGHTAVMRDFLFADPQRVYARPDEYF